MKRLGLLLLVVLAACGKPAVKQNDAVLGRMTVVDLEGHPLAGMMPIATLQPNAFDPPIAQGALTGEDGMGTLSLPLTGEMVFIRAWDPSLRFFAANYYDVALDNAGQTELMQITMVPGSSLSMKLLGPDERPLAHMPVSLMLIHPNKGPWWPTEGKTNEQGRVVFEPVPPGEYTAGFEAGDMKVEVHPVALPPGTDKDLGVIVMK